MRLVRSAKIALFAVALGAAMVIATTAFAAPVIVASADQTVVLGQLGTFDASAMAEADPGVKVHWDFGDGTFLDAPKAGHTFPAAGTYTVTLTATDASGESSQKTWAVAVSGSRSGNFAAAAALLGQVRDQVTSTPNIKQHGQRQRLLVNLEAAIDALGAGQDEVALAEIAVFVSKLQGKTAPAPGATYTAEDSAAWMALANAAIEKINAPAGQSPAGVGGAVSAKLYERSLPGATVTVYGLDADGQWAAIVSCLSDASGNYRVALVEGTYRVGAGAYGFTPAFHLDALEVTSATDVVVAGLTDAVADVALSPIQNGTEEFPYLVYDMPTLDSVRQHKSAFWRQIRDVDAVETGVPGSPWYRDGAGWLPIGSEVYPDAGSFFYGTYDGGGYAIRNLKIVDVWGPQYLQCVGLFRGVCGTVKNVNLVDADVRVVSSSRTPWVFGGLLCGTVRGGTIADSTVTGHLSGYGYHVGGVAGSVTSAVIDNVTVDVRATPDGDRMEYLGGITGDIAGIENNTLVTDCRVNFIVENAGRIVSHVGPIAGQVAWATVENCQTTGSISAPMLYRSGGLAGLTSNSTFRNCTSSVQSSGAPSGWALGGLFGTMRNANVVEGCVNNTTMSDVGSDPWP